jgi:hypothetical protein
MGRISLSSRLAAANAKLDEVERETRWQRVEDQLATMMMKSERLDERSARIETAHEMDDVAALRELLGVTEEDD